MDHPSDLPTETPSAVARPTSSDAGCLTIAAAFAAAPLLLLFGTLGGALQTIILIAALVVGIPTAWRRIKAGTNPRMTVLLLIGTVVLYALINGFVQSILSTAPH